VMFGAMWAAVCRTTSKMTQNAASGVTLTAIVAAIFRVTLTVTCGVAHRMTCRATYPVICGVICRANCGATRPVTHAWRYWPGST
jgi:hypothetical protein